MDEDSGNTQSQMSKRAQSKQPQKQNSSPLVDVETGENSGNTESQISKRAKSKKSQKKNKLTPLPQVEDGSDIEMGERLRNLRPEVTRRLFYSKVTPVTDYASPIWAPAATQDTLGKLGKVQRCHSL